MALVSGALITTPFSFVSKSCDNRRHAFQFLFSRSLPIKNPFFLQENCKFGGGDDGVAAGSSSRFRVSCKIQAEEIQLRRCSPFLESALLSEDNVLSSEWKAIPDIWRSSAQKYGDRVALVDPYHDPPSEMTYKQLEEEILDFSEGLRVIGLNPYEKIALFAENSCRWLVADQGIMATGAINVVRGSRSSVDELLQIYNHSESVALAVDNPELFNRIAEAFSSKATLRFVILLWGDKSCLDSNFFNEVPVYNYKEILMMGHESRMILLKSHDARKQYAYEAISSNDIATFMYTSGTTGNPKGVMLTHANILHQINNMGDIVPAVPGDIFLSMLPPWHAYERSCEYFIFTHGIKQVYTSVRYLKEDLRRHQPHYMISVPLVYDTLYSGIQRQISSSSAVRKLIALLFIRTSLAYMAFKRIYEGKCSTKNQKQPPYLVSALDCFLARIIAAILWPIHMLAKKIVYSKIQSAIGLSKAGISGGGSLPSHVDSFFEAIGIKIQNGYGLTETSPVLSCRHLNCNVLGSIGRPLRHTEIKVVDSLTDEILPHGVKGIVKARGPQVMKGYFKNPSGTKQVVDEDGWINTGDIGYIVPYHSVGRSRHSGGIVVLEGRAKDTIVLSTGENVEPAELEEASLRSTLIQQIVVIGQDQRRLGAIVVPNKEEITAAARTLSESDTSELSREKITNLIYAEIKKWTAECSFQIGPVLVIDEPFTIDSGLMTPTMKIRRDKVVAEYKQEIENMYK